MEGLAAAVVLIAILLGVLLVVAFDVFCLARLAARDDRGPLRKLAWAVAIVCVSPFGGLVYLVSATRLTPYAPRIGPGSLRRPRLPALSHLYSSAGRHRKLADAVGDARLASEISLKARHRVRAVWW
jgi:hypothetical protein